MQKIFLLFICIFLSITTFSQTINTKKLDSLFDILDSNHLAMGSVAIAKDGKIVYQRQIGYSYIDDNKKIAANADTKYRIGSITKMFTAVIIFRLIEEGKLSLDTKLAKFYPQIPNADKITIEMLLRHRSGLYNYVDDFVSTDTVDKKNYNYDDYLLMNNLGWLTNPLSKDSILNIIKNGEVHFQPNTKVQYCNSGYWLLGRIIENITHESFTKNVKKRIVGKINLKNTYVGKQYDKNKSKKQAESYFYCGEWNKIDDIYLPNASAAGAILSTPTDLVKFIQSLFASKLISKESLSKMTSFIDMTDSSIMNHFGMGIMTIPFGEDVGLGHAGDTYGEHSMLVYFQKYNLIIAYTINGNSNFLASNDIADYLFCVSRNIPFDFPNTSREYIKQSEELNQYLGVYSSKQLPLKFTFTKLCEKLFLQATGQHELETKSIAKNKFTIDDIHASMEFFPEKGELVYTQNGKTYLFTKDQ
ncbi:MAG: serine hydrolase [Arachidicoccus sp.]|nr:serine hydrolase [Arachidicoccus sp.]